VCIVDESGKVCRETKVPSHPEDLARALHDRVWCLSESVSSQAIIAMAVQWLGGNRAAGGVHRDPARESLQAQVNKSDRNDARASLR
jgi:hypothetical protein